MTWFSSFSEAQPADRIYVDSITASIAGYETMTGIEKVRALRLWVYQHTPKNDPLIHNQVVKLPLNDAYAVFAKGAGGVWCGGNAIMLSRVYKAAGFNSWLYDFGVINDLTHVTTLVEVDGDVILQDSYINIEYVDADGMPIPFLDLISRIVDGAPPTAKAGADVDSGVWIFSVLEKVESRGWPRQVEYWMLYPVCLDSLYSDGVAQAESLLRDIKRKIRDLPLDVRLRMHGLPSIDTPTKRKRAGYSADERIRAKHTLDRNLTRVLQTAGEISDAEGRPSTRAASSVNQSGRNTVLLNLLPTLQTHSYWPDARVDYGTESAIVTTSPMHRAYSAEIPIPELPATLRDPHLRLSLVVETGRFGICLIRRETCELISEQFVSATPHVVSMNIELPQELPQDTVTLILRNAVEGVSRARVMGASLCERG